MRRLKYETEEEYEAELRRAQALIKAASSRYIKKDAEKYRERLKRELRALRMSRRTTC